MPKGTTAACAGITHAAITAPLPVSAARGPPPHARGSHAGSTTTEASMGTTPACAGTTGVDLRCYLAGW